MKTTDWDKLIPHFAPEEYFSPEGLILFHERNIIPCDLHIMTLVECLRSDLNRAFHRGYIDLVDRSTEVKVYINTEKHKLRGYVTPGEWLGKRVKSIGQLTSFHTWCAVDVSSNVKVSDLFDFAESISAFRGVIGYPWGVHLDLRQGERYVRER